MRYLIDLNLQSCNLPGLILLKIAKLLVSQPDSIDTKNTAPKGRRVVSKTESVVVQPAFSTATIWNVLHLAFVITD